MTSKTAFFNKFLVANPGYVNVKDYNNILKHIIVTKPENQHIKVKFAKYQLMQNKTYFYKAQRLYFTLFKFVMKCKSKYIKLYNNDTDLCGNVLHNPLVLVENNTAYKFSVHDLQKVVVNALTNQRQLIPEPVEPKNPFTNLPFSKHNLLILYSQLTKKHPLFTVFYKCNFDINGFKDQNRRLLLDYAIETMLAPNTSWTEDIIDDIYYLCDNNNIRVHEDLPKDILYSVFRPYLKELYKVRYMFYPGKKLGFWLDCFELYNPYFGMKYIDSKGNIGFDTRHLAFNDIISTFQRDNPIMKHLVSNKYKNNELCITLKPIVGVTYFEPEPDDNIYYNSDEDGSV